MIRVNKDSDESKTMREMLRFTIEPAVRAQM